MQKEIPSRCIYVLAFLAGFSALIVQVAVLRKAMAVFQGNELIAGLLFAVWMLTTGTGTYIATKSNYLQSTKILIILPVLQSFAGIVSVFFTETAVAIFFPPGIVLSFYPMLLMLLVLLLPCCFAGGALFSVLSIHLQNRSSTVIISRVYAIEAAGALFAGLLFSFFIANSNNLYLWLKMVFVLIIIVILWITFFIIKSNRYLAIVIVIIGIPLLQYHFKEKASALLFPQQTILDQKETPYGQLTITQYEGQTHVYENNILLYTTNDAISREEAVHYALCQSENTKNICLIGGGLHLTSEAAKHHPEKIHYIDNNARLITDMKKYTEEPVPISCKIIIGDARKHVRKTKEKYDAVLVNLPNPSTISINRYYTIDFFRDIKNSMNSNAVFSIALSGNVQYVDKKTAALFSMLYSDLKKTFNHVIIISGMRNYFIASDKYLTMNIPEIIHNKNIENKYVNSFYFNHRIMEEKYAYIKSILSSSGKENRDYIPFSTYLQIQQWMLFSGATYTSVVVFLLLLLFFILFIFNNLLRTIALSGFSTTAMEIVMLILIQIYAGYMYQYNAVIIAVSMAGLAVGAGLNMSLLPVKNLATLQWLMAVSCLGTMLYFYIIYYFNLNDIISLIITCLSLFEISCIAGILLHISSRIYVSKKGHVSVLLYAADLTGAAMAALVFSVVCIPLIGIMFSVCVVVVLNMINAFFYCLSYN